MFRAFNPWRAIARAAGLVASRVAGPLPTPFAYPEWLGRWPAAATILGFAWIELAWVNGQDPSSLAIATLVYSAITLIAIACFGTEAWIRYGEGFSVYYNLFSRISAVEVRDGRLGLRRPLVGAHAARPAARDGRDAGRDARHRHVRRRQRGTAVEQTSRRTSRTSSATSASARGRARAHLLGRDGGRARRVIAGIYFAGIAGVRTVDRRPLIVLARTFVHTLVPIAAGYVIAHYFSFLAYNGQAILYLASDPLGHGFGPVRHRREGDRLLRHQRDRRSGTCRSRCWSRATSAV